jgi:hypothetical protein
VLNSGGAPVAASATASSASVASYQLGMVCVAVASMLSGLSAALTQRAVTGASSSFAAAAAAAPGSSNNGAVVRARNTMQLSAEMAVYGILFLLINLWFNNDIKGSHLLSNWDMLTLIPVLTNVRVFLIFFSNGVCSV